MIFKTSDQAAKALKELPTGYEIVIDLDPDAPFRCQYMRQPFCDTTSLTNAIETCKRHQRDRVGLRVVTLTGFDTMEDKWIPATLAAQQALVGGYIEVAQVREDVLLVANEEGLLQGLPINALGYAGNMFWIGKDGPEFRSLTIEEVALLMNKYTTLTTWKNRW